MPQTPQWCDGDDAAIAAHWYPALLIDLLVARGISSHKILRATGIFYEDLVAGEQQLSVRQLLQLIKNARSLEPEADLSFRWGSGALPGHCGAFSQLLGGCANMAEFLQLLVRYRRIFSPLLVPRLFSDERFVYLYWVAATGLGEQQTFLREVAMSSVVSASRWLHGRHLPWRFAFQGGEPEPRELYSLYFSDQLQFDVGIDLMMLDKHWLQQPFPSTATALSQTAQRALQHQCDACWQPPLTTPLFVEAVYQWLSEHIQQAPGLECTARAFCMSPATFKRKLKKHQCGFQEIQDQVRLHTSLYLFLINGWSNEQVANYLNFNDTTNFRRAFKRWSGTTPSTSKQLFQLRAG